MIKAFLCLLVCSFNLNSFNVSAFDAGNELHPFHISVTEIRHKPEDKVLQMTVRLFLDDTEVALREFTKNGELDILKKEDSVYLTETLGKYVLQNLKLTTKKELTLDYLGFEYDNDVLYCYIEVIKVKPFEQLTIYNRLLTSTFDDQENLVHVRKGGKVKSLRMTKSKDLQSLEWDSKK